MGKRTVFALAVGLFACGPSQAEIAAQREAEAAAARRVAVDDWLRSVDRVVANVERTGGITPEEQAALEMPAGCSPRFVECQNGAAEVEPLKQRVRELSLWAAAHGLLKDNVSLLQRDGDLYADEYLLLQQAARVAARVPNDCPETICTAPKVEEARQLSARVEERGSDAMRLVGSTREARLQYADLREARTRFQVSNVNIVADDYYNCSFRSSRRWRAFAIATPGDSAGMHIYCRRGEDWCDALFSLAVRPASVSAVALQFPRYNRVCEAGQAELLRVRTQDPV